MTPERKLEIAQKLATLSDLRDFPEKPALMRHVEHLADMCHDKSMAYVTSTGQIKTVDNDIDWLIDKVSRTFEFFPKRAVWRRTYCEYFRPNDGKEAPISGD